MTLPLIYFTTTIKIVKNGNTIKTEMIDNYSTYDPTKYDIDNLIKCYKSQIKAMQTQAIYNNKPHQKEYVIKVVIINGSKYLQ